MRVASVILFHSSLGVLYKGKYETRVSTRKQKMFRFMDILMISVKYRFLISQVEENWKQAM